MTETVKEKSLMPTSEKAGVSLSYVIMCAILFTLFFAKSVYFYVCIKIGLFSPIFAATSGCVFFLIYTVVFLIRKRAATVTAFTLYTLLSILMCIDVVYFSYINRLPSVLALKVMTLLTDVDTSVLDLVTLDKMIFLLDLPLWIIWVNMRSSVMRGAKWEALKQKTVRRKSFLSVLAIILAVCLAAMGSSLLREDFTYEYFGNEILVYHLYDAYHSWFVPKDKALTVDPLDYMYQYSEEDKLSPYYELAKGRNLIVIQVEAMQEFVLNQEYNGQTITPNLNRLLEKDTIFFENYYYLIGGGNTSDAEFAVNNSLFAPDTEAAYIKYEKNKFHGLPWLLKDNGYTGAHAFHGYIAEFWNRDKAYVNQGFDTYTSSVDFTPKDGILGMGISDYEFFMQSVDIMKTYEQPFYSFMITLSSHYPFDLPEELHQIEIAEEHSTQPLFGNYLQSMAYVDWAFEQLFAALKEADLYDNSVIVIYGDHFGIPHYDWYAKRYMTELLGREYYEDDVFRVPLIIHIPGSGVTETISTTGGHIDVTPTLLHLFGIENHKSVMFGQNLFTAENGIIYQQTHLARGSFISDTILYAMAQNGIEINNKAYNKSTHALTPSAPYRQTSQKAKSTIEACISILESDEVVRGER